MTTSCRGISRALRQVGIEFSATGAIESLRELALELAARGVRDASVEAARAKLEAANDRVTIAGEFAERTVRLLPLTPPAKPS